MRPRPCCCAGPTAPWVFNGQWLMHCAVCHGDWRNPPQIRRDAIIERHGKDSARFTGSALSEIANGGIYDAIAHYCPAGKLSMEETRAREAAAVIGRSNNV